MSYQDMLFSVEKKEKEENWAKFVMSPLPTGFGHTVGHSLRRTLLGALPGAAVTKVKIKGAPHEFTSLEGVKEDVVEIILQIKKVRFRYQEEEPVTLKLVKKGQGEVLAGDIEPQAGVEVANPDHVIANLTAKDARLEIEIEVEPGVGYGRAEEHESSKVGVIGVDSVFTPVQKVDYKVEPTRKGKRADLDKLTLELETDGSITPEEALKMAAGTLVDAFSQIVEPEEKEEEKEPKEENDNLDLMIEELDEIPLRLSNALKKGGYKKLSDLQKADPEEVRQVRNVGKKSIELLQDVLKDYDIDFS